LAHRRDRWQLVTEIVVLHRRQRKHSWASGRIAPGIRCFIQGEKMRAGEKKVSLRFIFRGGRDEAYKAFINALKSNPERMNALLVDSETPIAPVPANSAEDAKARVAHLQQRKEARGADKGTVGS